MNYLKIPVKQITKVTVVKNNCTDKIIISGLSIHNDKEITVEHEGKEFLLPHHKELIDVAKNAKPGDRLHIYRKTNGRSFYYHKEKQRTSVPPKYEIQIIHAKKTNNDTDEFKKLLLM